MSTWMYSGGRLFKPLATPLTIDRPALRKHFAELVVSGGYPKGARPGTCCKKLVSDDPAAYVLARGTAAELEYTDEALS